MEKKNNGYYKAVSILSYIFASFITLFSLVFIYIVAIESAIIQSLYEEIVVEELYGAIETLYTAQYHTFITGLIVMCVFLLATAAYTFVQAAYFMKYSKLTNEEASKYFNKCLTWSIFALILTGWLNGLLAFLGLFLVQKKQKIEFESSNVKLSDKPANNDISLEALDKVQERLKKLQELKNSGAITDQEYDSVRSKIMEQINK